VLISRIDTFPALNLPLQPVIRRVNCGGESLHSALHCRSVSMLTTLLHTKLYSKQVDVARDQFFSGPEMVVINGGGVLMGLGELAPSPQGHHSGVRWDLPRPFLVLIFPSL